MHSLRLFCCLFFLICNALASHSQQIPELKISYGECLKLGKVDPTTVFEITTEEVKDTVIGTQINTYRFEKPGMYTVHITNPSGSHSNEEGCKHNLLPEKIKITVASWRLMFDQAGIRFSKPIQQNAPVAGCTLTVTAILETYNGEKLRTDNLGLTFAGIGVDITGKLINASSLSPGSNSISFALQGTASQNSYVAVDFALPDGRIQSVALLQPILSLP